MKLKDFNKIFFSLLFVVQLNFAQTKVNGLVFDTENNLLENVEVFDSKYHLLAKTNSQGKFSFTADSDSLALTFFSEPHGVYQQKYSFQNNVVFLKIVLKKNVEQLSEIVIEKKRIFNLRKLQDVEGTSIYAGKKTEVVLLENSMAALASNNSRQIYNQITGLNIFQNDDAGLQLNIGGRGLDPNRTSNFNTRQNGYDISADVLGYPESYYTPAAEALSEIQIIRGAASLSYGSQFGGVVNFQFKKPPINKKLELLSRNTVGSFGLYTNFTSLSGTNNKWHYSAFYNFKTGNGFRENSAFNSHNAYLYLAYDFSSNLKASAEITYLKYLAKQAGGLTDEMFSENPFQSNRSRNWFAVDWLLYNFKIFHQLSERSRWSFSFFGLAAKRNALGFRGNYNKSQSNAVVDIDEKNGENYLFYRDLIQGKFANFGFETKFLTQYNLFSKENTVSVGVKYYQANNSERQGAGTKNSDADFNFVSTPEYIHSNFNLPNQNIALFAENIFRFSSTFSLTPGVRFEYIKTQSSGDYSKINRDAAGNVLDRLIFNDYQLKDRYFGLIGLGASYKPFAFVEFYANGSQNYRSVTFSDIRTTNPTFIVDPNISDEKGYTFDLGIRGNWNDFLKYDFSAFSLLYQNKIGVVLETQGINKGSRLRTNIGDAQTFGFETFFDWNLASVLNLNQNDFQLSYFSNLALMSSVYTRTIGRFSIEGKQVEFAPKVNLKTGFRLGYKNFKCSLQYTYLSDQFSDASNATIADKSGTRGKIPAYDIVDLAFSYNYQFAKIEIGANNLWNNSYFTRRALGYPGPGIIPSIPRNYYITLQLKW